MFYRFYHDYDHFMVSQKPDTVLRAEHHAEQAAKTANALVVKSFLCCLQYGPAAHFEHEIAHEEEHGSAEHTNEAHSGTQQSEEH